MFVGQEEDINYIVERLATKIDSVDPALRAAWQRLTVRRLDFLLTTRPGVAVSYFRVGLASIVALARLGIELEITR